MSLPPDETLRLLIDQDSPQVRVCRICGLDERDEDEEARIGRPLSKRRLIRPCQCRGTMKYVHADCLDRWRCMSPRPESTSTCDTCHQAYQMVRPKYAWFLTHPMFLRAITIFIVVVATFALAYLTKIVDVFVLQHPPRPNDPQWVAWHGETRLWMDRVYFFSGVLGVSCFGIGYFFTCAIVALAAFRRGTNPSAFHWMSFSQYNNGYDPAGDDETEEEDDTREGPRGIRRWVADVIACSCDAMLGGILVLAALVAVVTVVFGILGAVSGVYAATETAVEHIAGKKRDCIIDLGSTEEKE
ncbi:hypothetical protein BCR43DRAFT_483462 [Syncephalastrum racemosum]|uniref:RING-CH-type domain-containing protein n=1 Tax=Syncephalastrum racemosum TaxID=13706 RepID=A0A1X2HV94_SYNRA|nr:hypothetical protein BCR43DRAFT_483462 [Syncephalastrum racemosum]